MRKDSMITKAKKKNVFRDREESARGLCEKMMNYRSLHPLVLALNPEAVGMGRLVAHYLKGDLDVILSQPLYSRENPLAQAGAVSEKGAFYQNQVKAGSRTAGSYCEEEAQQGIRNMEQRRKVFTPGKPPRSAHYRVVILVSDGMAAQCVLIAALRQVDSEHPAKIVVATAAATPETLEFLRQEAEESFVLMVKPEAETLRDLYEKAAPIEDEEVAHILENPQPILEPSRIFRADSMDINLED